MSRYLPKVDRRTTLKWMFASLGSAGLASACGEPGVPGSTLPSTNLGTPKPVTGSGYGPDPDTTEGMVTWLRTMTDRQRDLTAALADVILPATDDLPAASEIGVPDFIDEWVSSPYERTQGDRERCFALLEWLEAEAGRGGFAKASPKVQTALLDRIAFKDRVEAGLEEQAESFGTFRHLAASAWFASDAGWDYLGYMGNRPITGPYPGPTSEALAHLDAALEGLNLTMPEGL